MCHMSGMMEHLENITEFFRQIYALMSKTTEESVGDLLDYFTMGRTTLQKQIPIGQIIRQVNLHLPTHIIEPCGLKLTPRPEHLHQRDGMQRSVPVLHRLRQNVQPSAPGMHRKRDPNCPQHLQSIQKTTARQRWSKCSRASIHS